MDRALRLETCLELLLGEAALEGTPPRLAAALRYAVFPGGARVRPRLSLAVALACGDDQPLLADGAAAAIELLHCASLVHDDMPCFDAAAIRRGKPSVHAAFGEPLALLAGDGLIVRAFEALAVAAPAAPARLPLLLSLLGASVGAPNGIVAGQAWECEPSAPLNEYQRAKTGALFAAATMMGAAAAGADPQPWRLLGESIGAAYQVADDILDANGDAEQVGKPVGRDLALDRPSAVREMGQAGSANRLRLLVKQALKSIPECPGQAHLRETIAAESEQFMQLALSCRVAA
jgi:geranylgeranyl diphosphate synthase type II